MSESKPIRILYMEDDPGLARLFKKKLERAGYVVDLARDGEEGLAMYAAGSYDVLAVDQAMPVHDGLEVIRNLASRGPLPPTIMITGTGDEQIAVEAMKLGASDYIVKDVDGGYLDLLPTVIEHVLQRQRLVEERQRAEMERERLLAAEHEQRLLAETLREVTLALTSQTSHAAVLDEILRQAQRIVPHSTANIALLEDDILRVVRWRGYEMHGGEECISSLVRPLTDLPLNAEAVRSREPVVIRDTHQEPRWAMLEGTAWIRSFLIIPICLRDRVLGQINLASDTPAEFSAEDAERLQPMASAAAIAIENARLVEGLEAEVAARTAEIRAEQEKSEAILRSVGDAIVMFGLEGQVQYVNDAFTALTGYTAEEALGQRTSALMGGEMSEQAQRSLRLALAKGEVWQGEVTHRRKDGRTYDAAVTIASMRDAAGNLVGYVSSHRDISQPKNLERARSRFITNVSHQLRTPVTTIQLYAHLLRKGRQPEKTEVYLQMVEEETAHLIHLIQDTLEMTVLDSGQAVTAWEPVSLSTVIGDIVTRYQGRAEASGLTLVAKPIPPDLPAVKGDQARLSRALREIVENAIIFTPTGGRVTMDAGTVEDEGRLWVTIVVRDTGPGISPEEQERVFDRFYRGSLAESGHVPGTGLGLSIAQEIMRAHGGRVTVESPSTGLRTGAVGKGSTFRMWLLPEEREAYKARGETSTRRGRLFSEQSS